MLTLYWEKISGAIAPHVLLEELGATYNAEHVDMATNAHKSAGYRSICPTSRVPALTLPDGQTIGETLAIILTLGELHPASDLVPQPGDSDRPRFLFWLSAMATGGYPTFSRAWHPEQFTDDDTANDSVERIGWADLEKHFDMLEAGITGAPFFLPRGFTMLDVYLAMMVEWMPDRAALFAARPRTGALCRAVYERPSWRKVAELHDLPLPAPAA